MSEQATQTVEQTAMPKHGEFCWNALGTKSLEEGKKFYGELFGWDFKEDPTVADSECKMPYVEIGIGGAERFGGMYEMTEEFGDTPPQWMSYIAVDDVDAAAQKVWDLGGKICMPPTDIPDTGRFCVVSDPSGATFSMITLKR